MIHVAFVDSDRIGLHLKTCGKCRNRTEQLADFEIDCNTVRLEIIYAFGYNFTTLPCEADMKGCTIKHNACRGGFHFLCCRM